MVKSDKTRNSDRRSGKKWSKNHDPKTVQRDPGNSKEALTPFQREWRAATRSISLGKILTTSY